jgi:hypothetical protein
MISLARIALGPFHADNFFELRAFSYLRIGKLDLARADLAKALERNPNSEVAKRILGAEAETSPPTQPATTKATQPPDKAPAPAPPPVAPPPPA